MMENLQSEHNRRKNILIKDMWKTEQKYDIYIYRLKNS